MIVSFHSADLALRDIRTAIRTGPKPTVVPGLRTSDISFAAPLSPSPIPKPSPRRLAVVSLWDDDAALDHHLATGSLPQLMAHGWHVRLEPLRLTGSWPGLPEPAAGTEMGHDGPTVVLTLGRTSDRSLTSRIAGRPHMAAPWRRIARIRSTTSPPSCACGPTRPSEVWPAPTPSTQRGSHLNPWPRPVRVCPRLARR